MSSSQGFIRQTLFEPEQSWQHPPSEHSEEPNQILDFAGRMVLCRALESGKWTILLRHGQKC
jgi:hypothetical protein